MKRLLIISLFIPYFGISQTVEVNNLKVNKEIITTGENLSPDRVITIDKTNDLTTFTKVTKATSMSFLNLADSLSLETFDRLATPVFSLADSTAHFMFSGDSIMTKKKADELYGGSSYTFTGGLTEDAGVVKVGGVLTESVVTTLTGSDGGSKILTVDFGSVGFGYDPNFEIESTDGTKINGFQVTPTGTTGSLSPSLGVHNGYFLQGREGEISLRAINDDGYARSIRMGDLYDMTVRDDVDSVGFVYHYDYSANGLSNNRWIPDLAAVQEVIHDSIVANSGGSGVMQIAKAEVLYSNTSQTTIITLPANAVLWGIGVEVVTVFNDSGTDYLNVGVTGDNDRYLTDGPVHNVYFEYTKQEGNAYITNLSNIQDKMSASTNITFQYTGQNSDATTGQAFVYIHYTIF